MGDIGTIRKDSLIMTAMKNFDLSKETLNFVANRTINVCIRTIYCILCRQNKEWENPELLNWWKLMQRSRVICQYDLLRIVLLWGEITSCKFFCLQITTMWSLKKNHYYLSIYLFILSWQIYKLFHMWNMQYKIAANQYQLF